MARNVSKQGGRSNVNAGESSRHAVPYLVQGDEDDDDTMAQLSEDSNQIQVRQANVVASSGHMAETTVPNFLLKLWRLVEDKNYDFCICWDESGSSFHVKEPYTFSKDVLPLFFKHSNLNSFIRQLNMYGFRKVTNLEQGALKHQANDMDSLEFHHQYFVRGHPELLQYIRRKSSSSKTTGDLVSVQSDASGTRRLNQALEEIRQLREKQMGMDAKLNQVKRENESLWREMAHMRQLHLKQQQVVNKLIQFLLTVVQPASGGRLGKRNLLAIGSSVFNPQTDRNSKPSLKRARLDSGDAVEMIESLEQELKNRPRQTRPRLSSLSSHASSAADAGPTIADITEELESGADIDQLNTSGPGDISVIDYLGQSPNLENNVDVLGTASQGAQLPSMELLNEPVPLVSSPSAVPTVPASTPAQQQQPTIVDEQAAMQQWPVSNLPTVPYVSSGTGAQVQTSYNDPILLSPVRLLENDNTIEWSKPSEFSQYLNYVQSDLDSLKDFLSSEGLELDANSLDDLFVPGSEALGLTAPMLPITQGGDIVGNELQLYKAPELMVDFNAGSTAATTSVPAMTSTTASTVPTSESVPVSGGLAANEPTTSPIFATPSATEDQASLFDQLNYDLLADDPIIVSSQGALSTPIMSPGFNPFNQPAQQNRVDDTRSSTGQATDNVRMQDQPTGNGVRTSADDLVRSSFSKSKGGKKR